MRFGGRNRDEPSTRVRQLKALTPTAPPWRLPWPLLTALAAVLTAGAGWLLVAGFCLLGWISVPQIKSSAVLQLGTQGWLLAHGVSVALPGARLSITPLGLTILVIALGLGACQQAVIHSHPPLPDQVGVRVVRMGLTFGLTYIVVIGIARSWTEGARAAQSSLLAAVVLVFGLGLVAFARALNWRPTWLPLWLRTAGLAVLASSAVLVAGGAAALATAILQGRDRIVLIHDALAPGNLGGLMLLLGQLAWLPNFILWCGAWVVGAGVQLGVGTLISPAQSLVGMLPAIPVFGAVPPAGPMPRLSLAWLAVAALAGLVAARILVGSLLRDAKARGRTLGVDQAAIVGALVGIVGGLVFTLLQVPASGDLGSIRLVDLGARLTALAVMAPTAMGLAGMATGAVLGWRGRRGAAPPSEKVDEAEIPTTVVASRPAAPGE